MPVLLGETWVTAWLAFLVALALLLGLEWVLLPARRRLDLTIAAPTVVHLMQPAALHLRATARFAADIEARVELHGDCEPLPPLLLAVVRDLPTTADLPLRPHRRGTLRVAAVHVRWRGPLGLLWREHRIATVHTIKVQPDVWTVRRMALALVTSRDFQLGLRVERYLGDGTEFEALRDYVPGMDRRSVDWKASARHRALLSRHFRAERNHQVMLCIDSGRLMGEPLDGFPRLDHAIHAALQLGHVCLRTGDRVGAFVFAQQGLHTLLPAAGLPALQAIQDRLTAVDYSTAETNYTRSLTDLLQQLRRRTLVVLFTDFVDSIAAELMLPNVAHLARRHLVLFVALRDPLLQGLAERAPESALDLHRAVVAADMAHERQLVLERIRRSGCQVVDAGSSRVAAELVDRYLQIKRRERV